MTLEKDLGSKLIDFLSDKSAFEDNLFDTPQVRDSRGCVVMNFDPVIANLPTDEGPNMMVEATVMDIDDCNSRVRILPESICQIQGFLCQWIDSRDITKIPKVDRVLSFGLRQASKSMNKNTLDKHGKLHKNGIGILGL